MGRRQKLPTETGRIALEMPRAAKIDSKKKPLSLSDVNDFRFGSAHLWTQLELLGTCAGGESKIAETSGRKQSKLMGLDLIQPEGSWWARQRKPANSGEYWGPQVHRAGCGCGHPTSHALKMLLAAKRVPEVDDPCHGERKQTKNINTVHLQPR